ncbi:DUF4240 domain-containing protein [Faecalibacter rhinopitheci]|uniref:DUF4240 domain-containing protein n=1 Tax=Faecalibacter rhinopitheci TaxID=2779678 RepID=A0A8J7K4W6_9FLAO|nr:DUF4240 domain-containing protein [Faecalibacter rhinopitheci]MBF0597923.1 DUF4240 domain-containing protein [Faecalibacter rhinopitheci]
MSFLDNLFNSLPALPTEKISQMLDTDLYWQIIENSLQDADTLEEQQENLFQELSNLTAEDIIGFRLRTEFFMFQSYSNELWCAGSIMNDGCDEDGFQNFRLWLISQGKEIFSDAMIDADNLAKYFEDGFNDDDLYEFENFSTISNDAFLKIFKNDIHDFIDYENFNYFEEDYNEIELNWDEDNITTLQAICPRLFTTFIENASEYDEEDDDDEEDQSDEFDIE